MSHLTPHAPQRVIEEAIGADDDWNDRDGESYRQGSLTALWRLEPPSVSSQICMNRHSQVNTHRLQGFAAPSSSVFSFSCWGVPSLEPEQICVGWQLGQQPSPL